MNYKHPKKHPKIRDPVCGMIKTDKFQKFNYEGTDYYFCGDSCITKFKKKPKSYLVAEDPMCNMKVSRREPAEFLSQDGKKYYFCSPSCLNKFNQSENRLNQRSRTEGHEERKLGKGKILYICPMDPEIVSEVPGDCPKCGMALEPTTPQLDSEENQEYLYFKKLFFGSLGLSLPILFVEMSGHFVKDVIPVGWSRLIQFFLSSMVMLFVSRPIFAKFISSLTNRSLNMWSLIGLGTGIAYLYSVIAYFFDAWFPAELKVEGVAPIYFETVTVIITLVFLGQVLELKARSKTSSAIQSLLKLTPNESLKIDKDKEVWAKTESLQKNDCIRIRPGDQIPIDGKVIEGHSSVDESMLTGESIPINKNVGDELTGGSINGSGSMVLEVTRVGSETTLSKIIQLVANAQRTRPPIQKYADRISGIFVPLVVSVAVITFFLWWFFGPSPSLIFAIVSAISVLIIACPCAIGLATPISIVTAIGRGAKRGLLIRNAEALELFSKVKFLVVDKTGTLTEGKPYVDSVIALDDQGSRKENDKKNDALKSDELLSLAYSLARYSEHPLAKAIEEKGKSKKLNFFEVTDFESRVGKGVVGKVNVDQIENQIAMGNLGLLQELGISADRINACQEKIEEGATPVFLVQNKEVLGLLSVIDPIKKTTLEALEQFRNLGVKVCMATGDHPKTAKKVANSVGITEYRSQMTPEDKADWVKELRKQGEVAMAGDGINDAPALSAATVGIAMGTGSDIAIESAGVTLVHGDLNVLIKLRWLSKETMKNIRQNLFFAFFYNFLGIPIAAGIFYPWLGWLLSPMLAAGAMSLSSVSVITNALRLRKDDEYR